MHPVILGMCLPRYALLPTDLPASLPDRSGLSVPRDRRQWADPTRSRCRAHQLLATSRNPWHHLQMTFAFDLINGKRLYRFPARAGSGGSFG